MSKNVFEVSTKLTGRKRKIGVVVHRTPETFYEIAHGEGFEESIARTRAQVNNPNIKDESVACCVAMTKNSRNVAVLHFRNFNDEKVEADTVVHEVAHAAIELYRQEILDDRQYGDIPIEHMSLENELLPELIADLTIAVITGLAKRNHLLV